ncbi:tRNA1(Val) (adenine(37)-N6)-methyltransferase [Tichowtungia aerotolerans]|uniref:tRNA1(Val) (adenine(37)-N6)-methyltransferase n=1 Tax=Tichowtungia aerotolerans TaxID=2697043 RepID=A0A6P1M886_9BACT|nr:methyltransferase [Tichowtungia aerotolerans]QHI68358.1 methyltransferase [Tichowtungia aerotolerans]
MENQRSGFTFKRFHVFDDRCAMKVGTDAVLLGAWAPVVDASSLLDIGTGCGILSLMLAQRGAYQIDAIDMDAGAVAQAEENAAASPWAEKIRCMHSSLQDFQGGPYDLLVSNPPYFNPGQTLKTPERQTARHCGELSHGQLLRDAARLSHRGSRLALILPSDAAQRLIEAAPETGWVLSDCCDVLPKPDRPANRQLLCFQRTPSESVRRSEITVRQADGQYSPEFIELCRDFYLLM